MKTELQERADSLASNLQRSIDACFEVLQSIGQFFASSGTVERHEFQRFVQPALARHPSLHALEWLPRLLDGDRPRFEQQLQAEGFVPFQISENDGAGTIVCAPSRPEYFPVYFAEPLDRNRLVLGYDLASDPTRRAALEKARDTGTITLSGRITLVQDTQEQYGFLVIMPIYQDGTIPATVAQRQQDLRGFALGVFQLAEVVESALSGLNLEHIDFYLGDRTTSPDKRFLAYYQSSTHLVLASPVQADAFLQITPPASDSVSASASASASSTVQCQRHFSAADRQWSLMLAPTSAYVDRAELYQQSQIRADAATAEAQTLKRVLRNLQGTQAKWLREKKLIALGAALVLLILGSANGISYWSMNRLLASKNRIQQTYTALVSLAKLVSATAPAAAPDDSALANAIALELDNLQQAVIDDPAQLQRVQVLRAGLRQYLGYQPESSPLGNSPPGSDRLSAAQITALYRQLQSIIIALEQQERSRLPDLETQAASRVHETLIINIISIALSLALLLGVYYLLQRQMNERQQVESALFEANNQLEIEVKQRLAELEQTKEISELKMRLFSMVSHEFRTPLSTILVSTQLLAASDSQGDEKRAKNLSRIQTAAKAIAQLLSDILTLNRAEASKLEFRPEPIDIELFCQHIIDELQLTSPQPIRLSRHGAPTQIYADSKLLQSILTNLLSNAIKYSPPDRPIDLSLTCRPHALTIQVRDNGIGIPPDDQQNLYDAFHRGKNVGNIVGTGIGLAVVKACVDLHGGDVQVESEVGVGSTFTVTLPQ